MVTKGGPHSGLPEGHPVVTKGVDPTIQVVKKMDVSPDIIPTEIDLDSLNQLPQLLKIHTI